VLSRHGFVEAEVIQHQIVEVAAFDTLRSDGEADRIKISVCYMLSRAPSKYFQGASGVEIPKVVMPSLRVEQNTGYQEARLTFRRCREAFPGNFRRGQGGGLGVTSAL
jgi:hypothetical protein